MPPALTLPQAILLGIVEGLTEFLPVSSTGHLILVEDLLAIVGSPGKVFEVAIQLGAILAVCVLYRAKIADTVRGLMKREGPAVHFTGLILAGFLPAMVLGFLLHGVIKEMLFNPYVVSVMLVLGGIAILIIEKVKPAPRIHAPEDMSLPLALKIGFFQALAMVPGVSRSGATIMGALCLGVERRTAAEFSFFLAIPTMFAATVYDLFKNRHDLSGSDMTAMGIGFVTAFLVAMVVVKGFMAFIGRYGFVPFAWYRIGIGTLMLALIFHYS